MDPVPVKGTSQGVVALFIIALFIDYSIRNSNSKLVGSDSAGHILHTTSALPYLLISGSTTDKAR